MFGQSYRLKRVLIGGICFWMMGMTFAVERPRVGFYAGIGFPKIPPSHFRTPISLLGGALFRLQGTPRWGGFVGVGELTTLNLGTVDHSRGILRFDLRWMAFGPSWRYGGLFEQSGTVDAGIAFYRLDRRIDAREDRLTTPGITLGLSSWLSPFRRNRLLELRWHLLFRPEDNPQLLSLAFGWLL